MRQKMLLHVCCAPCSLGVLDKLKDYDITLYYFNPCIYPQSEYDKRYNQFEKIGKQDFYQYKDIIKEEYDPQEYETKIKGYEQEREGGKRCEICYRLRLEKTAQKAKELGYDVFTTTLSVSPYKNAAKLNAIGKQLADKYGVNYYEADFKKQNGFLSSTTRSKQLGIYRQNYCGCKYSMHNE